MRKHLLHPVAASHLIGVVGWLAGADAAAREDTVRAATRLDVVDRAIDYHGGQVYSGSSTRFELCSLTGCYQVMVTVDGGLYRLEVEGPARQGERRVQITNDAVMGWEDGRPLAISGEGEQSLRDWVMARVYFCFLPFRLNDDGVFKQDLGIEIWESRPLHKVKVSFAPGSSSGADSEFMYWFDPTTARLEQFAYSFRGAPGGLRFRRAFNYRRLGGILFYDQENWGIEGDGWTVEDVDPELVRRMRRVSTIELHDPRVSTVPR